MATIPEDEEPAPTLPPNVENLTATYSPEGILSVSWNNPSGANNTDHFKILVDDGDFENTNDLSSNAVYAGQSLGSAATSIEMPIGDTYITSSQGQQPIHSPFYVQLRSYNSAGWYSMTRTEITFL